MIHNTYPNSNIAGEKINQVDDFLQNLEVLKGSSDIFITFPRDCTNV